MQKVMSQTFERAPTTLDGFTKAVGKYHGLKDASAILRTLEQEGDKK